MKQTADLDKFERNMRPGVITRDGMLGRDRRHLGEILLADDAAVRRLGLAHARLAARLRELREAGAAGLGIPVPVEERYLVLVDNVRGRLPCPFEDCAVQKTSIEIECLESGRKLVTTDLNIHMIEAHGFYQGEGSAYRVAPGDLADFLQLAPEPDGEPMP